MIIGITGTNGAGKGQVVRYLVEQKGFTHYSVRDFLVEEIKKRNMPVNRESMVAVANDIREKSGPGYIVEHFLEKAAPSANIVIESVRSPKEADRVKEHGGHLWAVDADFRIRYERVRERMSETDEVSLENFIADEQKEYANEDATKGNLAYGIKTADVMLHNNGGLERLYSQVEQALKMGQQVIRADNYQTASLEDWQRGFYFLYGHIDDKRTPDSLWRHATVNAALFSADIRKNNFGNAFTHLAHILCWTLSFAERCRRSAVLDQDTMFSTDKMLSDFVWEKYPFLCPYCKTSPCSCSSPGMVLKKEKTLIIPEGNKEQRPHTLDAWSDMFEAIYGQAHSVIPLESLSLHLWEETGEVTSQIIRITEMINGASAEEKKHELFREVADVFSWICSVTSKINKTYFYPAARHFEQEQDLPDGTIVGFNLSKVLWDEYGSDGGLVCPTCHQGPCVCDQKLKL